MENPFNYFDKIYVISDKNNSERRAYVSDVLSNFDLEFEFFDAVIGAELSEEEIDAVYDEKEALKHKTNKRPISKPEIGCALSHMGIYKKIISENLDNALIFEDDIDPDYEAIDSLDRALKELPQDWDLLHLGTLDHYKKAPLGFKLKRLFYYPFVKMIAPGKIEYTYGQLWNLYPRPFSKTLRRSGYHLGCQSYVMRNSGAKKFFNYHDKIVTPVDNMLSVMIVEEELNAFITDKIMFRQNQQLESSLENSRLLIRQNLSKKV